MTFSVSYSADGLKRKLAQLQLNIQHLPGALINTLRGQEGRLANVALQKITQVPPPPVYPIRWKSQRQRKAFFASKGFGKGIPTRRNYALLKGWRVKLQQTPDGGTISLTNPVSYMEFVQGSVAQPFHLDTGWVQKADVMNDFYRETRGQVIGAWQTVAHKAAEAGK